MFDIVVEELVNGESVCCLCEVDFDWYFDNDCEKEVVFVKEILKF